MDDGHSPGEIASLIRLAEHLEGRKDRKLQSVLSCDVVDFTHFRTKHIHTETSHS